MKFIDIPGSNASSIKERFLREARVAAAIQHQNVVDLLDFGTSDDGRPFMVMELLPGQPLADRLRDGPAILVPEAIRLCAYVLSGLAAVHDAGIVHRDLKPENIFLVRDPDGAIYPRVLDFGISRSVGTTVGLKSVLPTMDSVIAGTPQYMSPEQARGVKDLDARSDLWSVGIMLYEMLSGTLPYDAQNVGDIIVKIATEDPVPFSDLRPDLKGPITDVIEKSMKRDRDDRFADARAMREALLQAVEHTPGLSLIGGSAKAGPVSMFPVKGINAMLDGRAPAADDDDDGESAIVARKNAMAVAPTVTERTQSDRTGSRGVLDTMDTPISDVQIRQPGFRVTAETQETDEDATTVFRQSDLAKMAGLEDGALTEAPPASSERPPRHAARRALGWAVATAALVLLGLSAWAVGRPALAALQFARRASSAQQSTPNPKAVEAPPTTAEREAASLRTPPEKLLEPPTELVVVEGTGPVEGGEQSTAASEETGVEADPHRPPRATQSRARRRRLAARRRRERRALLQEAKRSETKPAPVRPVLFRDPGF